MKFHQNVGLAILTATLTALTVTACGEDEEGGGTGCSADADCQSGEICHPGAKLCVKTCESAADCEDSAKDCGLLSEVPSANGAGGTTKICRCATDQLCGGGTGSSTICSTQHDICVTKCTDDDGCPTGLTCDTATGECSADGGPAGTSCNASEQQPANCGYGSFCNAGTCADVPAATCTNFTAVSPPVTFNESTSTGPVIYRYVDETTDDTTFCGAGTNAFTLTLFAYTKGTNTFPAAYADLSGFFYVEVNGNKLNAVNSMRPSGYTRSADGKHASFKLTLCSGTTNQVTAGFYFNNGNPFCAVVSR